MGSTPEQLQPILVHTANLHVEIVETVYLQVVQAGAVVNEVPIQKFSLVPLVQSLQKKNMISFVELCSGKTAMSG